MSGWVVGKDPMPAQAIWWDLEASSVGAQARRLRRLSEDILECGYTAIKTNLMALEDLERLTACGHEFGITAEWGQ